MSFRAINIDSKVRLRQIELLPDQLYNISLKILEVDEVLRNIFTKICTLLRTTTDVETLKIEFWLDAPDLLLLGETMTHNESVKVIDLLIDQPIHSEAFKKFIGSIQSNKTLKNIKFTMDAHRDSFIPIFDSIKGLQMPTRYFTLNYPCYSVDSTNEHYLQQIEVQKSTNINQIEQFSDFSLFEVKGLAGFEEFCDHVGKQNTLQSYSPNVLIDSNTLPPLARLVSKCKSLRELHIQFDNVTPEIFQTLLDVLVNSNIKKLTLMGGFDGRTNQDQIAQWTKVAYATRLMKKLTNLSVRGTLDLDATLFFSESMRKFTMVFGMESANAASMKKMIIQNIKLQNEHVRTIITIAFNIARNILSAPSHKIIPLDVWGNIMSFVRVPGVSLDFGLIAQSIFKDSTVRRVIYKSVKSVKVK